ncbi:DUF3089 domain-containing protein [Maricaulis sp. D1M11]|uniref:DUF3089 domain-containing protein n=1 Tax=Maricaulis sp. D1M11 TaxID=3076117 RepID=UPI0039B417C2
MTSLFRRIRLVLIILTGLTVTGCNVHWRAGYGFLWVLKPGGEAENVGVQPDYGSLEGWLAHPQSFEAADILPEHVAAAPEVRPAAAFYVHPTSLISRAAWNQAEPQLYDEMRDGLHLPNQASALQSCCDVFAPRYRQATFYSFADRGPNGALALDIAYSDVEAAFDAFLAQIRPDRPIILAGHSQGSAHIQRLMVERFDDAALRRRLVVSLVPGYPLAAGDGGQVLPCASETDSGCFLSWNIRTDTAFIPGFFKHVPIWDGSDYQRADDAGVCHDPGIETAAPSGYLGGFYLIAEGGPGPRLLDTGAQGRCESGWLTLTELTDERFAEVQLSGGWLHAYEYALVWGGVRADLQQRLAAWESAQ